MRAADTMLVTKPPHGLTSDISRSQAARVQHPIIAAARSAAANADVAPPRSAMANATERQPRAVRFVSLLDSGSSDVAPPPPAPTTQPPAFDPALASLPESPRDAGMLGALAVPQPVLTPTISITSPASSHQ